MSTALHLLLKSRICPTFPQAAELFLFTAGNTWCQFCCRVYPSSKAGNFCALRLGVCWKEQDSGTN